MYYKPIENKNNEFMKNSDKYPVVTNNETLIDNFNIELIKKVSLNNAEKVIKEYVISEIVKTASIGGFGCIIKICSLPKECRNIAFEDFIFSYFKNKGFNICKTKIEEQGLELICYFIHWN